MDKDAAADQRRWRRTFWLIFFATPTLSLLAAFLPQFLNSLSLPALASLSIVRNYLSLGIVGAPVLGSLACGYCLMKQRRAVPTTLEAFFLPIAYGVGILIIYICILFVGCIVVVSPMGR